MTPPSSRGNARRAPASQYVVLTLSATLDGKIATTTGESKWISCEESRRFVHVLRNQLDAVLVGSGTVLVDDPKLTCRIEDRRDPVRIIVDRRFRVSPEATVFTQASEAPTWVVTCRADAEKEAALTGRGHRVIHLPGAPDAIRWTDVMRAVAAEGIKSVLVEGRATVASSILTERAADELMLFYAPLLIGGDGKDMVGPLGVRALIDGVALTELKMRTIGNDILVTASLDKGPHRLATEEEHRGEYGSPADAAGLVVRA